MSEERLAARVTGRVQGVGFRWWARTVADELGLTGWVMNADDERSVDLVAEGAPSALDELERRLRTGPAGARIEEVEIRPAPGQRRVRAIRDRSRVNRRTVGCGSLALAAFLLIGAWGVWRATGPAACPDGLPYQPAAYEPVGDMRPQPTLDGVSEPLEPAGTVGFGFASWPVWVEPGRVPTASGDPLPQRIVLECGDGFQAYQRGT